MYIHPSVAYTAGNLERELESDLTSFQVSCCASYRSHVQSPVSPYPAKNERGITEYIDELAFAT